MIKDLNSIKVLIVDDSALVREILYTGLNNDPAIEVVGVASDAYQAWKFIRQIKPDVITMDIEMPKLNGIDFIKKLLPIYPIPILMVSSHTKKGTETTLQCLSVGAVDFVTKPSSNISHGLKLMIDELCIKIKAISKAKITTQIFKKVKLENKQNINLIIHKNQSKQVIAIGASTGGTEAIKRVVSQLPVTTPGIVIVQHMPAEFTKMFAKSLNEICLMEVKEAKSGDRIINGRILIAPGGYQMEVEKINNIYRVKCTTKPKLLGHKPSVGILFNSVASSVKENAIGIILTGMGKDGAEGLLQMKNNGAYTIAQDEETSVVYGMPAVAKEIGACRQILPLDDIQNGIIYYLKRESND